MPAVTPIKVELYEPDGKLHTWKIEFKPLPRWQDEKGKKHTTWGDTDWPSRTVTINSRVKNLRDIFRTLLHEAGVHVTCGQVGSEWLAEAIEANVDEAFHALEKKGIVDGILD